MLRDMHIRSVACAVALVAASTAHADSRTCKAGALIFGNPTYKGRDKPNPQGQTIRQDPPLDWQGFVFTKKKVFLISGASEELWGGDLAGAIKLIAGARQPNGGRFADGPCAQARFAGLRGLAVLGDG